MSAVKLIFKRSSLLGKRPTGANLTAGEIALNTNSNDPGLFFEVSDGSVVKAGPTAYLSEAPAQTPARGELWVDSDTKALSIGDEEGNWQKVAAPFLGGTNGLTVFVAPDYQNATDSLANDGQTVPFVTINRAILEVTKKIIKDTLAGVSLGNNRYLIMLAPGQHCVVNAPGQSLANFNVNFNNPYTDVTQQFLSQFNDEEFGGLILPRGVSIIGLDLKKCELHPTYVPKYTHPAFPPGYQQEPAGPVYQNEPVSSLFRWSGNTYVSNFTGLDKVDFRIVNSLTTQESNGWAIFKSNRSHGLGFNDFVQVSYTDSTDQVNTFQEGAYYAYPLTSTTFALSSGSWDGSNVNPILAANLPTAYFQVNAPVDAKFNVWNIYPYYIPADGVSYELSSYSHHRLSVLKNASLTQLNAFYTKVQRAFSNFFANQVNPDLVSAPEYDIVAPTVGDYPNNVLSNSTDNSSPYQNAVNHRSDYGMANGDYDGNLVSGFKSVIVNSATAVILQKDPVAYELYATTEQNWVQLTEYAQQTLGGVTPITSVKTVDQLKLLNEAPIPNIRYYYTNLIVIDPDSGLPKSIGIPNPDNDFRHFGFRMRGPNSYMQAQSTYTIGAAIACWAKEGAIISLTNASTNFGSVAFQSEGFAGINTIGGANAINKGFLLSGITRPLSLLEDSVVSDQQKRILSLGTKIVGVGLDPNDPKVQHIYLQRPFDPASILPYSLKPGSAVFTTDALCTFRAFFVTDGSPTAILSADGVNWVNELSPGGGILRVRVSDSTVPNTVINGSTNTSKTTLDIPYIRRFVDPRVPTEKSYGFYIQSTNPPSQAPQLGSVLRLNQGSQALSNTIKRNVQFDPGSLGGISHIFTVDTVETERYSSSANFNYKVSDASQGVNYVVYASLTDASTPWVQSVPSDPADLDSPLVPFYNPQGSYITYGYKNYYAAENNLWTSLYYYTGNTGGPTKVTPDQADSPFVITSVLESTELVTESWQGAIPDPYYDYYVNGVPAPYNQSLSYMRGAVVPYTEYGPQYQVDDDDSSNSMGIIFTRLPLDSSPTVLVANSTTTQTPIAMTAPGVANPSFGRPEIIQLEVLSVQQIVLPKEGVSVLQLTNPALKALEYVRVISVTSNVIQAIRNCYPDYAVYDSNGKLPTQWPKGTTVRVCTETGFPEPSMYDPDWAVTKATMFRFFRLMGYDYAKIAPYLKPQYYGERVLLNESLPLLPSVDGYAKVTTAWPIEFNNPSTVIANTHTWQYAGYFDYSRGLPKYQVNEIPKKLSYDFLSMTTWGGRLTVMGANETGQLVFLGPIKEALTGQYYLTESPLSNAADKQVYQSPEPVVLPNPVLVYSADDISGGFNGVELSFPLQRGGYDIPLNQIGTYSVFVILGGVVQKPFDAYYIQGETSGVTAPRIVFTEAPLEGTSCDVRIVTTGDNNETLEVIPFELTPSFDGTQTSFQIGPYVSTLNDLNSFVFLGGTEQNPAGALQNSAAYTIQKTGNSSVLSFIGGSPQEGTVLDFRGIVSGERYRNADVSTVFVASADDLSTFFDNTQTTFPLTIGGVPLDPTKVNAQNIFVSLGGVMQIPIAQEVNTLAGNAYTVQQNLLSNQLEITFSAPPAIGTTCNLRIVTSDEFLTCPIPPELFNTTLQDGPGIIVNAQNQIIEIDSGLIS